MEGLWVNFKVEPTGPVDRWYMKCERKEGNKNDSKTVSLSTGRKELPLRL